MKKKKEDIKKKNKKKSRPITVSDMWDFIGCLFFSALFGLFAFLLGNYLYHCNWACEGNNCEGIFLLGFGIIGLIVLALAFISVVCFIMAWTALLSEKYEGTEEE